MNQEVSVQSDYDEIDLVDLIRILMKSWKLIVALFLITIVVVGSVTYFWIPKKYRSHTLFYLEAEGDYGSAFGKANMVKDIIQTNYFLGSILEKHGLNTIQAGIGRLRSAITITQTSSGNIKIELIWDDPQQAYDLLSSVYSNYQDEVGKRIEVYTAKKLEAAKEQFERSKEAVDQANAELVAFQEKTGVIFLPEQLVVTDRYYQDLKGWLTSSPENLREYENLVVHYAAVKEVYKEALKGFEGTRQLVEEERKYEFIDIEPPVFPERKHSPSTVMNTAIAGVLALFVGVMLAFLRDYIQKYKEREQVVNLSKGA